MTAALINFAIAAVFGVLGGLTTNYLIRKFHWFGH